MYTHISYFACYIHNSLSAFLRVVAEKSCSLVNRLGVVHNCQHLCISTEY